MKNTELSEEARALRNKRAREYYQTHKQQYRETNRRYWERQAAKSNGEREVRKNTMANKTEKEASFWIAHMVLSNMSKTYDRGLYPVQEFVSRCIFSGLTKQYAKKIYQYILNHKTSFFELFPGEFYWCYVSGEDSERWDNDYFVIPVIEEHTKEELSEMVFSFASAFAEK